MSSVGDVATFRDVADRAASEFGDAEAFVQGSRRITYLELRRLAGSFAGVLHDHGLRSGDVLALALPSSIDFAVAHLAGSLLGAVTTGLNPRLGPTEVRGIVERCRPTIAVVDTVVSGHQDHSGIPRLIERSDLAALLDTTSGGEPPLPRIDPSEPVCIVWTSGTTGAPKGAWFDHRSLAALSELSGLLSPDGGRRLVPLPFAHAGFMTRFWDQTAHAICAVLLDGDWTADLMLETLEAERVTVGQGVPTQWIKLLEHPSFDDADLSHLEIVSTGSAVVPPELVEQLRERLGVDVIIRYACSEVPIATGCRPDDSPLVLSRTVGRPAPGIELELRDDDGTPVEPGRTGTVHLRSPGSFGGYWNDPERTAETRHADGWIGTSDLGHLDEHGNLVLVGRRTDMYIRGGYNVHPLEVELVLGAHPRVERAAVIGVATPVIGEIGVAFVIADTADPPDDNELREWCRVRMADYKVPDRIVFVDALPVNAMLKVNRAELRVLADHLTEQVR